ncbi:hypothetical protein EVJ50_05785 [Synechococcus sp. RSCCF101]|uniref:hypothetical protein n=1 Tax=Synechococcus sp. RSCCF101 TaxID=2511069 RepID=UPI0012487719|nr:hypothetical protein [Synechococcus sp. RSCCF101]QEY31825.1 hypothetical protein EVJ50_05785 [Synechococcus sp. RSCCF101]
MDVVVVVDSERISLAALLAALVACRTFPESRYHFAAPSGCPFWRQDALRGLAADLAIPLLEIPTPALQVEGRPYRILNKVQALAAFGARPALLTDSDLFFHRPLPAEYLTWRACPAAVPEHGQIELPWQRLYEACGLPQPQLRQLCGSGAASRPWFNAGLVAAPDAAALGRAWLEMAERVNHLEWVPRRFPYLDQIALPLAMASLAPQGTLTAASVLDGRLNQNLFHWQKDQSYVGNGIGLHHHGRLSLVQRYLPGLLPWAASVHPQARSIIDRYAAYEEAPSNG